MNFIQLLNYNTIHVNEIEYEALSFFKIVENYFELTSDISDRAYYILKNTWSIRYKLFRNIRYENLIIGIVLYTLDEFNYQSNNTTTFVEHLYGSRNSKQNLIQIYKVVRDIRAFVLLQIS